jgi:methionine biosynthesis protein MetW
VSGPGPAAAGALRADLALITEWIAPGSRILDLGCGDGALLAHLARTRGVRGYGLEIDPDNIARCLAAGVNVIEADVDDGLKDFSDGSFDYVVMTQALQATQRPDRVVDEILRVGRTGIVTFPNFGHWKVRLALARGRMPTTPALPEAWYSTANIHLCTVADFEAHPPAQPDGPLAPRRRRAAAGPQPAGRGGAVPAREVTP